MRDAVPDKPSKRRHRVLVWCTFFILITIQHIVVIYGRRVAADRC